MKKNKPFPALCKDCRWSKPEKRSEWNNRCFHPKVVSKDSWALANNNEGEPYGVACREERQRRYFSPCSMRGKLWEAKK
jgi:hypothetical protein